MKKITDYNDKEISIFQFFFHGYLDKNDNLTKSDAFILGNLSANFQYYVRVLKDMEYGKRISEEDAMLVKNYNSQFGIYTDLIDYLISQYEEGLEELKEKDIEKYYQIKTIRG